MLKFHLKLAATDDIALCGSDAIQWVSFKEFTTLRPDMVCEACRIVAERKGQTNR
jgi:hypothetical protein